MIAPYTVCICCAKNNTKRGTNTFHAEMHVENKMSTDWCPQPQMQHSNVPTNTPKMKVSLHFCCNMFLAGHCQQQRAQTHWSRMFIHKFVVWIKFGCNVLPLSKPGSGSMLVFHGFVRQACLSHCSLGTCIKKIFEKCLQIWNESLPSCQHHCGPNMSEPFDLTAAENAPAKPCIEILLGIRVLILTPESLRGHW